MHPCLAIPEIFLLICDSFFTLNAIDDGDAESALARLARTRRSFTVPAVTILWKVLHSFSPLIRCMPLDLWVRKDYEIKFRRALRETDWERYDFYASKVIQFGAVYGPDTQAVHRSIFMRLATYRPSRLHLPNLRKLVIVDTVAALLPSIEGFIGPKLEYIEVYVDADFRTLDMESLFSSLPRLAPSIGTINFVRNEDREALDLPFFDMLKSLERLSHVTTNLDLPRAVLRHLASLPSLVAIAGPLSQSNIGVFTTNDNQFSNLEALAFTTSLPAFLIAPLLEYMDCQFVKLEVTLLECFKSPTEVGSFVSALHGHRCRTSLQLLDLDIRYPLDVPSDHLTSIEIFRPLFLFSALTSLTIEPLTLEDSSLKELAEALPNLRVLQIPTCRKERPRVTWQGVLTLIHLCPKLDGLRITFDARDPFFPPLLHDVQNRQIKLFDIDHSMIVQPLFFPALMRVFPCLEELEDFSPIPGLYTEEDELLYSESLININRLLGEIRYPLESRVSLKSRSRGSSFESV